MAEEVPVIPSSEADKAYICATCGLQYAPAAEPPASCKICTDARQYVPKRGQKWTTQADLVRTGHRNCFQLLEPNLYGIGSVPTVAIGQRALLVRTAEGNLLWDCITLLDQATIDIINGLGGIRAIAISHPHYYSASTQWSQAFGDVPIHIHAWDEQWLGWPHSTVELWEGESKALWGGLSLVHLGGHFAGGAILHWKEGAGGKGALLTGDILQVCGDRDTVSIMRSYPNFIPLSPAQATRIKKKVVGWAYDRIHGAFWNYTIETDAKEKVEKSLDRYLEWLQVDDIRI